MSRPIIARSAVLFATVPLVVPASSDGALDPSPLVLSDTFEFDVPAIGPRVHHPRALSGAPHLPGSVDTSPDQ